MTHLVMAPDTYQIYKTKVTKTSMRKGIRYSQCHQAVLCVLEGLESDVLIALNRKNEIAAEIIDAIHREEYDLACDIIEMALDEQAKPRWMSIGHLPLRKSKDTDQ